MSGTNKTHQDMDTWIRSAWLVMAGISVFGIGFMYRGHLAHPGEAGALGDKHEMTEDEARERLSAMHTFGQGGTALTMKDAMYARKDVDEVMAVIWAAAEKQDAESRAYCKARAAARAADKTPKAAASQGRYATALGICSIAVR